MSDLPNRMRVAADVLEAANERFCIRPDSEWNAHELRKDALLLENEERESAARDALVLELAQAIGPIVWSPHDWEKLTAHNRRYCLDSALDLINAGWRKD